MKKLFLTSVFKNVADELVGILPSPANQLTVAFVPTAADVYEDKWFEEADRDKLVEMGFKIIDLPLKNRVKDEVEKILKKADVIFVAGGNTFYLLEQTRASGFIELTPKLVNNGIIYIGSSAGSYLACPTIEVANWKHQDRNIVGLTDLTALSLVPFLMSVHYNPEYDDSLKQGIAQTKYPVKILTDNQALIVQEDEVKLVGQGEEIKL